MSHECLDFKSYLVPVFNQDVVEGSRQTPIRGCCKVELFQKITNRLPELAVSFGWSQDPSKRWMYKELKDFNVNDYSKLARFILPKQITPSPGEYKRSDLIVCARPECDFHLKPDAKSSGKAKEVIGMGLKVDEGVAIELVGNEGCAWFLLAEHDPDIKSLNEFYSARGLSIPDYPGCSPPEIDDDATESESESESEPMEDDLNTTLRMTLPV